MLTIEQWDEKLRRDSLARRDNQKQRVYNAEESMMLASHKLHTIGEIRTYANSITQTKKFQKKLASSFVGKLSKTEITVKSFRGYGGVANRNRLEIRLNPSDQLMSQVFILHELAHIITPSQFAPHGPEFCKNYLWLVKAYLGQSAYDWLKWVFKLYGVKFRTSKV